MHHRLRSSHARAALVILCSTAASCGGDPPGGDTEAASSGSAGTSSGTSSASTLEPTTAGASSTGSPTGPDETTAPPVTSSSGGATDPSTGPPEGTGSGEDDTGTGRPACAKNVVVMGYWPPTNEMLRPWSTNPLQNPDGWQGADWGGYGYDVYSFFPEFPPDGDPTNDQIGEPGAVGSPDFDLRVDYQATTADFWRIVDEYQPILLVTTSRGGEIGWEVEALEGGHGMMNMGDPSKDWASDKSGQVQLPTMDTVEPRTWDAISMYRKGMTLPSQLPMDAIVDAAAALGLTSVQIDQGTSGNFLSGFLALHGLYYNQLAPHNLAAGHIHVGIDLPVADASALIDATLHAVLQQHPADAAACP
ncbi:MAG: hypothetical protein JNL82_40595 [Myxococcales bacterium]|nr:hypothetical protein [Myxococcales bacterium]